MTPFKAPIHRTFLALAASVLLVACSGGGEEKARGELGDNSGDNGGGSANSAPTLTILSPDINQSLSDQTVITFSATATDAEDGDIGADIEWSSNLDGVIGTGSEFSTSLSSGEHLVSATVTDSGNVSADDSIELTVRISQGFATVSWVPPALNTDGSVLNDLTGYKIVLGSSENNLNQYQLVNGGASSSSLLENLVVGETYFYAIRAINQYGIESQLSGVSSFIVTE